MIDASIEENEEGCLDCEEVCQLIDNKCLCKYSTLKWMSLNEFPDLIEQANAYMEGLTGYCDLCEGFGEEGYKFQELIKDRVFKRLYAALIQYYWSCDYGYGQDRKAGHIAKKSDEFSEFELKRPDYSKMLAKIEGYKNKFISCFESAYSDCYKAPKEYEDCGCIKTQCDCNKIEAITDTVCF